MTTIIRQEDVVKLCRSHPMVKYGLAKRVWRQRPRHAIVKRVDP